MALGLSSRGDAFLVWGLDLLMYCFPPILLQLCVLRRIKLDRAAVILISPWCLRPFWFTTILQLASCPCIHIQLFPDLLSQKNGRISHFHLHLGFSLSGGIVFGWTIHRMSNLSLTIAGDYLQRSDSPCGVISTT